MLVNQKEITNFIPQRPPMVMVDGLLSSDEKTTTSLFRPGQDCIFCKEGFFSEAGLIENMAQTAALRSGYEAHKKSENIKVGFIGAVKKFRLHFLPQVNDQLETKIQVLNSLLNASIVKASVEVKGEIAAQAELSIFTPADETE
jgi:3-hydroxymyristoyl/3-hydroxydecanoyl-(acyl carrier protein) dehydratase